MCNTSGGIDRPQAPCHYVLALFVFACFLFAIVRLTYVCHSEFLKRDDQILALRLQQDERLDQRKRAAVDMDRRRAQAAQQGLPFTEPDADIDEDVPMDDMMSDNYGSKTIVIHIGSQNMRLGLATDALPKTVPMVIARKSKQTEAEDSEPQPKRMKLDPDAPSEEWFGEDVRMKSTAEISRY